MKTSLLGFISSLDTTKEILNNPKDRSIETIQTEKQIDTK